MKAIIHRGIIEEFQGSWFSGLGALIISGKVIHCENAPTVRALEGCFGNVIASGHTVNQRGIKGKDIIYSLDGMGLILEAFTPTREWRSMYGKKNTPKVGESLEIDTDGLMSNQ